MWATAGRVLLWVLDLITKATAIVSALRHRSSRDVVFPFRQAHVDELADVLSSPLRHEPTLIERVPVPPPEGDPRPCLIVGGPGTGKTRTALEFVRKVAAVWGDVSVYWTRGFFEPPVELPSAPELRRVVVVIDDFDRNSPLLSSERYEERQSAVASMMVSILRTHDFFRARVELVGFFVTANSCRLVPPVALRERIKPLCNLVELDPVSGDEFASFFDSLASALGMVVPDDVRDAFVALCDGQFGTLATYISLLPKGSALASKHVEAYHNSQKAMWRHFRGALAGHLQEVYDCFTCLRALRVAPRVAYAQGWLRTRGIRVDREATRDLVERLWHVRDGIAVRA